MKKLLLLIATVFIANVANAQWQEPLYFPADELKGEQAHYSNQYWDDTGYFVSWSNDKEIKIGTSIGIFDYDYDNYVNVIIGFYVGDALEEKVTTKFWVPDGISETAYSSEDKEPAGLGLKIINHLKTKGKVRFIAPRYTGGDFDLTVPMNRNIK